MTHAGPYEGYYPGASRDIEMASNDEHGWMMRTMLLVDLPFSAALDTVLLPYDYYLSTDGRKSARETIAASEKEKQAKGHMNGSGYTKPKAKDKGKK